MEVYTIGYGNRQIEDILKLLQKDGITHIIDVRRANTKSWDNDYMSIPLTNHLRKINVKYFNLSVLSNRFDSLDIYDEWLNETSEGESALCKLQNYLDNLPLNSKPCLFCAEKDYNKCHRGIIADAIERYGGYVVYHL